MKSFWKTLWNNEEGIGTLELLLIVAVLVIIAVAFRKWIMAFIKQLFGETNSELGNKGAKDNCFEDPSKCVQ